MERFAKAVSNVMRRYVESGKEVIELYDVWIDTSIPMDIIEEVLQKGMVEVPKEVREIKLRGKTFWRREEE